jgi:Histidine kinase-like ATPase domain
MTAHPARREASHTSRRREAWHLLPEIPTPVQIIAGALETAVPLVSAQFRLALPAGGKEHVLHFPFTAVRKTAARPPRPSRPGPAAAAPVAEWLLPATGRGIAAQAAAGLGLLTGDPGNRSGSAGMAPASRHPREEGLVVHEQVQAETFGRHPGEVLAVRRFVRAVLAGHPAAAEAELLACELVTNTLRHAHNATTVTVTVTAGGTAVHIEVTDDGTAGVPHWREAAAGAEGGWGFHLVNEIATRWGFLRDKTGTCCWFDLDGEGHCEVPHHCLEGA